MRISGAARTASRTLVRRGVAGLDVPLGLWGSVGRRFGWAPGDDWVARFEGLESRAFGLIGSVLDDPELLDEGRRHAARARELRQAHELRAEAERTRSRAESDLEHRHRVATDQHRAIEESAAAVSRQTGEKETLARRAAQRAAEAQAEAAEAADAERKVVVERAGRAARATRVREEAAVLAHERQAIESEIEAEQAEAQAEDVHQRRRTR